MTVRRSPAASPRPPSRGVRAGWAALGVWSLLAGWGAGMAHAATGTTVERWYALQDECIVAIANAELFRAEDYAWLSGGSGAAPDDPGSHVWRDTGSRLRVTLSALELPDGAFRRLCRLEVAPGADPYLVMALFAEFRLWSDAAVAEGWFSEVDFLAPTLRDGGVAAFLSGFVNPRGCRVTATMLAIPQDGNAALSVIELAEPGCGGGPMLGSAEE